MNKSFITPWESAKNKAKYDLIKAKYNLIMMEWKCRLYFPQNYYPEKCKIGVPLQKSNTMLRNYYTGT